LRSRFFFGTIARVDQPPDDKDVVSSDPQPGSAEAHIVGLAHFKRLLPLLHRLDDAGCDRDTAGNRTLLMGDYCAVVMLYLFNPMIDSLRSLQRALGLNPVAKALGVKRFSLGSFSESVRVFDPQRLKTIVQELAGELAPLSRDPRLAELKHALTLVDGSVLQGLCRLTGVACTQTRYCTAKDGRALHGWRLHMQLDLETFCPRKTELTGANKLGEGSETHVLRQSLESDRCYVGDGGYADRGLFDAIVAAGSSYVTRMREDTVLEVLEERILAQEALDANLTRDALVRLTGTTGGTSHTVRIIMVQVEPHPRRTRKIQPGSNKSTRQTDVLLIATNLIDLPAELIALIYRYRYSVELFFRLFKQLLGLRHLLSQRREGVEIQVYCCVIACMLINLQTGMKPNKALIQMLGFHLLGLASEQDVIDHLNKPDNTGVKVNAKAELWKKLGF
jgi:Transposase DDE domain